MQQQVQCAKPRDAVHQLDPEERAGLEPLLLRPVERMVLGQIVVRREQEATRAARRIADRLPRLRGDHIHHGRDERPRREVLPRPTLHVLGVLLQQALVGIALHVGRERGPLLLVDQIHDEPPELGRILDLVLRLAEDEAKHPRPLAEFLQRVAVVNLEVIAVLGEQGRPVLALRDR